MKEQISSENGGHCQSYEELIKEVCDRLIWIDAGTIKARVPWKRFENSTMQNNVLP